MSLTEVTSVASLSTQLAENDQQNKHTLLFVTASFASAASSVEAVLKVLAARHSNVDFIRVDADVVPPSLITALAIQVVPTVLALPATTTTTPNKDTLDQLKSRAAACSGKVEGAVPAEVTALVTALASGTDAPAQLAPAVVGTAAPVAAPPAEETEAEAHARIASIVSSRSPLLLMKGAPGAEQCGFSRKTVALLEQHVARGSYQTLDILADPSLRKHVKTYADWPTFPQLWVQGELVGGLDILREMDEAGELAPLLQAEVSATTN
eukprot:CAMPEP_0170750732 /NCGR_PEP_ID=MMETSP0437-20130122/11083_1 /TAXON_ID=0 /ORGANISM="Sexangularia sp." /LENGTH=266 /DNA_ID=CAMNT_0011089737 /DNA_START=215 /DNA_END=1015 /DNA_ORIENTATION=+